MAIAGSFFGVIVGCSISVLFVLSRIKKSNDLGNTKANMNDLSDGKPINIIKSMPEISPALQQNFTANVQNRTDHDIIFPED